MTAHSTCCEADPPCGLAHGLTRGILSGVLLIVLPKCPMCLAAYIAAATGIGLTFAAASHLRTALLVLCAATLAHLAVQLLLRRLNKSASSRTE